MLLKPFHTCVCVVCIGVCLQTNDSGQVQLQHAITSGFKQFGLTLGSINSQLLDMGRRLTTVETCVSTFMSTLSQSGASGSASGPHVTAVPRSPTPLEVLDLGVCACVNKMHVLFVVEPLVCMDDFVQTNSGGSAMAVAWITSGPASLLGVCSWIVMCDV